MSGSQQQNQDMKPSYAITSKLLRVVAVLTLQYHGKNIFLLKILYTSKNQLKNAATFSF
jgi:hypothetical protein